MDNIVSKETYKKMVNQTSAKSKLFPNLVKAFIVGGLICVVGELFIIAFESYGIEKQAALTSTSIVMVFLGAFFTALGLYPKLGKFAGAGSIVPITGFSNSIISPAVEFNSEGIVNGTSVKIFTIAGPVIVFGICTSVIVGLIKYFLILGGM